jgi:hypothetical protein
MAGQGRGRDAQLSQGRPEFRLFFDGLGHRARDLSEMALQRDHPIPGPQVGRVLRGIRVLVARADDDAFARSKRGGGGP